MTSPEFLLTGDRQRWVEERREERGGTQGEDVRIIDDPFVCFAAEDFESIAACGRSCQAPRSFSSGGRDEQQNVENVEESHQSGLNWCGFISKGIFLSPPWTQMFSSYTEAVPSTLPD